MRPPSVRMSPRLPCAPQTTTRTSIHMVDATHTEDSQLLSTATASCILPCIMPSTCPRSRSTSARSTPGRLSENDSGDAEHRPGPSCPVSPLSRHPAAATSRDILPHAFHCHTVPVVGLAAGISSSPPHSSPLLSPAAACRPGRSSANKTPESRKTSDPCFRSVSKTRSRYTPADYLGVRLVDTILTGKRYCRFQARFNNKHLGYFDTDIEAALARDAYMRTLPSQNALGHRICRRLNFPDDNPETPKEWRVPSAFNPLSG